MATPKNSDAVADSKNQAPLKAAEQKIHINKAVDMKGGGAIKAEVVSDRKVPLSVGKCWEHLKLERFIGERHVDERHVQELYDEHARGRFMWEHVIMATATLAGKKYGINGQHTAFMRTFLPEHNDPTIRYIEYRVPDEENLRRLYGVFDTHKGRTYGHLIKAFLAGTQNAEGVWPSTFTRLASGLKFWLYSDRQMSRRYGANEMASLINGKYNKSFTTVAKFWQTYAALAHLKRMGVFAAMFATWETVPSKAEDFWRPVADGLGLDIKSDPRYKLREFLLTSNIASTNASMKRLKSARIVTSEEVYRICILAWNKWRSGERADGVLRPTKRRVNPK